MREIRFRAYDLDRKEFDYFDLDTYDKYNHDVYGTLEQFTGLQDMENEDVFAGDRFGLDDPEDRSKFTVVFELGAFRKRYDGWDDKNPCNILTPFDLTMFKRIGNIHQVIGE